MDIRQTTALRLHEVRRVYGTGGQPVTALDGVSLTLRAGTFTAVMGPSGSGKSTLLQCAAGLDRPTSGQVLLDGVELTGLGETALTKLRRQRIGFIFQQFNLLPTLTMAQNVALPLRLAGERVNEDDCERILDQVGLGDRQHHRPAELSGGQQQRAAIARTLLARPSVTFADEPTGALDTASAHRVLALLSDCVHQDGRTVVMVTHDPTAAAYADAVLFLADGRLVDHLPTPTAATVAARMTQLVANTTAGV
jgi:putative ABC transport system ATP-binding protein